MNVRQLEYLMKIVECGSITHAAQQLGISQPSLTKSMLSLEGEYNLKIFDRHARGVQLTAGGREFVHYARGVLSAVRTLDDCAGAERALKTRLSIGTQQLDFIYPLFAMSYKNAPEGKLFYNLIETDRNDVVRQILAGEVDLGFAVRSSADSKSFLLNSEAKKLEAHVIDFGGSFLAMGPKCPLYDKKTVTMDEAVQFTQIALDMEAEAKDAYWSDQGRYDFFNASHIIFCNNINACEYFLTTTDSVSFTSPWTRNCYKDERIHVVPVLPAPSIQELLWIKRSGEPLSLNEADFLSIVYKQLCKDVPHEISKIINIQTSLPI